MPRKSAESEVSKATLDFTALVEAIRQAHDQSASVVNRVVNMSLTLRNWAIGWYIREYEQEGADRAKYGSALLKQLAERLGANGLENFSPRYLRLCRQFAALYPDICVFVANSPRSIPRFGGH